MGGTSVLGGESQDDGEEECEEEEGVNGLGEIVVDAGVFVLPEYEEEVVGYAEDGIGHYQVYPVSTHAYPEDPPPYSRISAAISAETAPKTGCKPDWPRSL